MGKYFATDLQAKEWAAAKFQALYRGREHRRMVERRRLDMLEAASLVVDACDVMILNEREACEGYDEFVRRNKSRLFVENAGDGEIEELRKAMKGKKNDEDCLEPLLRGFR